LTDLVCDYQQWKDGLVHAGILSAAQWFLTDVAPQMLAYCRQKQITRIRLVGHSLGAATASILTILLKDHLEMLEKANTSEASSSNQAANANTTEPIFEEPLDIRCYSYGPPGCVSLNISRRYADIINAYVLEDDIVCRLSYGSVMDLKAMMLSAAQLTTRHYEEVLSFGVSSAVMVIVLLVTFCIF
jgi:hypothetical protein